MRRSRRYVSRGARPTASTPSRKAVKIVAGATETTSPRSGMSVAVLDASQRTASDAEPDPDERPDEPHDETLDRDTAEHRPGLDPEREHRRVLPCALVHADRGRVECDQQGQQQHEQLHEPEDVGEPCHHVLQQRHRGVGRLRRGNPRQLEEGALQGRRCPSRARVPRRRCSPRRPARTATRPRCPGRRTSGSGTGADR